MSIFIKNFIFFFTCSLDQNRCSEYEKNNIIIKGGNLEQFLSQMDATPNLERMNADELLQHLGQECDISILQKKSGIWAKKTSKISLISCTSCLMMNCKRLENLSTLREPLA